MRRPWWLAALFTLSLGFGGATCTPPPPADAGPDEPVCTGEEAEPATLPGETGTGWEPFEGGETLATWPRPQGGIGTRINVRGEGYSDDTTFRSLTTQVFGEPDGTCQLDQDCPDERMICDDSGSCRQFIANQVNRTFPVECREDGALLVPELPVRFRNNFELEELDGRDVELRVALSKCPEDTPLCDEEDEEETSSSVDVTLEVGEFVIPSWWEES